jgi:catechol 2,3-dioxygenase
MCVGPRTLPNDERCHRGLRQRLHGALSRGLRLSHARRARARRTASDRRTGAADRSQRPGVSEAIYLDDPDGNGIELYRDRPRDQWPRASGGEIEMFTAPLDLRELLAEA